MGQESWFGFEHVTTLSTESHTLLQIPLPGHSYEHCAYAVHDGENWTLHAGDAFYHHSTLTNSPKLPRALAAQEFAFASNRKLLRFNQECLRQLAQDSNAPVQIINAHDPAFLA